MKHKVTVSSASFGRQPARTAGSSDTGIGVISSSGSGCGIGVDIAAAKFPRSHFCIAIRIAVGFVIILSVIAVFLAGTIYASAAEDKPLKKVSLQLRWDHQFQFAGYYAAKWQGYYADAGFDVEIRSAVPQDGNILSATDEVAGGKADYGVGAADILLARGLGKPLVVVASIYQQSAAVFYAREDSPFSTPKDLLNLVVSRNINDLIDIELQAMLMSEGIDIGKIRSIPQSTDLEDFANHVTDVFSGYIIAEPYQLNQKRISFKTLRPVDYGIDFYGDSLFTTEKTVKKDPAAVERFRIATIKGWEYALDHPDEVSARITSEMPRTAVIVGGTYGGFNEFQISGVQKLTFHPFVSVGNTNPNRWRRMSELMKNLGMMKEQIDTDTFVFDYSKLNTTEQDNLIRTLVSLLLLISAASLAGLAWLRIFGLRKEVKRQTAELIYEKTILENSRKELETTNEVLVKSGNKLQETEYLLIAAKEAADAANVAQGNFLANMSHEIRTPMNGFMGMLQLLEMTGVTDEQKKFIEIASRSSDALLVVINDILDYSKMEAGKMELARIPFSIRNVVQDVMSLFEMAAAEKSLGLYHHMDEGIPENLLGDPFRLRQILSNLVGNAVKFTRSGQIDLYVHLFEKPGDQKINLEFLVRDTGTGFPAGTADQLFKRFSQADSTNDRKHGGTGLGLAISKSLVELMSGNIWVDSREGEGSSFHFTCVFERIGMKDESAVNVMAVRSDLELESTVSTGKTDLKSEMTAAGMDAVPHPANVPNILVAEDDEISIFIVKEISKQKRWTVTSVKNGREAVDMHMETGFNIILMDVQMPVMNGFQATALIRSKEAESHRHTPIIAMTAKALKGDREMCLEAGMDDYLSKPIIAEEFYRVVEKWMDIKA